MMIAYVNIAEALSYRYEQAYPETKINLKVSKEDQAWKICSIKKVGCYYYVQRTK